MTAICIIPARGGSKGIRQKNVRFVGGKPLIAWSIEQAKAANLVSRVIVATDDDEIANVAWGLDADVFIRAPETATDTATSESAILQVLIEDMTAREARTTVFLQATSPIRQPHDIDRCVEMTEYCDSVFSARTIEGYTWSRGGGVLRANYTTREPRQCWIDETLEENGSVYAFNTRGFIDAECRIFGRTKAYPMHPLDSYQVDEPGDLALIETLLRVRLPDDCRKPAARE